MPADQVRSDRISAVTAECVAGGLEIFRAILDARRPGFERFTDFRTGLIDQEEGYKVRNHEVARERLAIADWSGLTLGSGQIAARVIAAIEIHEDKALGIDQNNVLVWWPPAVAHRSIIDIRSEGGARRKELESHLRDLYLDLRDEAQIFDDLAGRDMLGRNYPLLGYLFFLKDIDRFVPVTPSGLQAGLVEINAELLLKGRASWINYRALLTRLEAVREELARQVGNEVRLIDAHSFVWVIGAWSRPSEDGRIAHRGGALITAAREKALRRMVSTILDTVKNSHGQSELRRVKEKKTDMTPSELEKHIAELMEEGRTCALTGCRILYDGEQRTPFEKHFLVSADRIDSDLGYLRGNIQLVCQFANFFKGHRYSDPIFLQLLESIRNVLPIEGGGLS